MKMESSFLQLFTLHTGGCAEGLYIGYILLQNGVFTPLQSLHKGMHTTVVSIHVKLTQTW